MRTRYRVTFDYDPDPDYSWLEQSQYNPDSDGYEPIYRTAADMRAKHNPIEDYANPENHVTLCMLVERIGPDDNDWQHVDSLGGIDFLADSSDWFTGTFYSLKALRPRSYLRQLAREAGMR
jgi:hypothetical protein